MKVGDKVWLFDGNRRVYPKSAGMSCAPIFSEHFYEETITGETSRSWIVGRNKFPKKEINGMYTDSQKAEVIWEHDNRRRIMDRVSECSIAKLRMIDDLLQRSDI